MSLNRKKAYWALQVGGWGLYLIVILSFLSLGGKLEERQFMSFFLLAVFYLLSTHVFRLIIRKRNWINRPFKTYALPLSGLIVGMTLINYSFQVAITFQLDIIDYSRDFKPFYIVTGLAGILALYCLWLLLYFLYHYIDRYNKSLQYEAKINEIELNQLKAQLNPHFIFNALNSIRALVDEDPDKSKHAITKLSNILRNSLAVDKKRLTSFSEELSTVKDYLDLEIVRFEERLMVDFNIHPSTLNHQVPPMMLQTLVENGIKHGISTLKEGGKLSISAISKNESLIIRILNTGRYLNGKLQNNQGMGIQNTRQRLHLIYGNAAKFKIQNAGENTVLTELHLPQSF